MTVRLGQIEFIIQEVWEPHHFNITNGVPEDKVVDFMAFLLEFPGVREVEHQDPGYWLVGCELAEDGSETLQLSDLRNRCIRAEQQFFVQMLPEESE
jgi:hypothetical protein